MRQSENHQNGDAGTHLPSADPGPVGEAVATVEGPDGFVMSSTMLPHLRNMRSSFEEVMTKYIADERARLLEALRDHYSEVNLRIVSAMLVELDELAKVP